MKDSLSFISQITNGIQLIVENLNKEKSDKNFTIKVNESNLYWCINWNSCKKWKTDALLKEYFQVQIWSENDKYSVLGEHRIEDLFEHLSDEYFHYEKITLLNLNSIIDEILLKIKNGVYEAIDKEFDSDF